MVSVLIVPYWKCQLSQFINKGAGRERRSEGAGRGEAKVNILTDVLRAVRKLQKLL